MAETDTVVAQGYARVMVNVDEYRRLTEAATELARLQAENEALRRELGEESDESMWRFWRDKAAALATKCDTEKAAREAAEAKAARLEEALRALVDRPCAYHGTVIHIPADSHGDAMMRVTRARVALEAK